MKATDHYEDHLIIWFTSHWTTTYLPSLRYKLDSDISEEMIAICKPDSPVPPNIYQLIEEKEKDLVLAAELGKALLDKNEEISHRREMITLDYTQKLEVNWTRELSTTFCHQETLGWWLIFDWLLVLFFGVGVGDAVGVGVDVGISVDVVVIVLMFLL